MVFSIFSPRIVGINPRDVRAPVVTLCHLYICHIFDLLTRVACVPVPALFFSFVSFAVLGLFFFCDGLTNRTVFTVNIVDFVERRPISMRLEPQATSALYPLHDDLFCQVSGYRACAVLGNCQGPGVPQGEALRESRNLLRKLPHCNCVCSAPLFRLVIRVWIGVVFSAPFFVRCIFTGYAVAALPSITAVVSREAAQR